MNNDAKQPDRFHVFVVASLTAYGAVAILCRGSYTSFEIVKSRIAPLKGLTLPKLELMVALIAARLCNFVFQAPHTIHLWSDCQIVLHWITGTMGTNAFVSHRIKNIHNPSGPDCWRYCPTQDNPANILIRGITFSQLKVSTLWKHGPPWLTSSNNQPTWHFSHDIELQVLAAVETTFTPSTGTLTQRTTSIDTVINISYYCYLSRLLRVAAYL